MRAQSTRFVNIQHALFAIALTALVASPGCTSVSISSKPVTTLKVESSTVTSTYGDVVTFTATASIHVSGSVTFYDGKTAIGQAALQNDSGTLTTSSLGAGSHTITAAWPGDATGVPLISVAITQTVNPAIPNLVWTAPSPITFGTALSSNQLDASSGGLPGTLAYTPTLGTVLPTGSQTLSVTFTPTDSTDYATVTQSVQLTVNKATPTIVWSKPEPIDYGVPLSAVQLAASSSAAGTFAYSPSAGTILDPGSHSLTVAFIPSDPSNYNGATATVTLNVVQPSITVIAPAASVFSKSSAVFTVTVTGAVNKNVRWMVEGIPGGNPKVGTITDGGAYTAPDTSGATITITATLQANPAFQGSVAIRIVGLESSPGAIGFAYYLPTAAATSAGVYDTSGNLVRTLWSNQSLPAGPQAATWDGNDDFGNPAPAAAYNIRVLYNNVQYTWGVIGDTSDSWLAANSWDRQVLLPKGMAIIGDTAYVANGYEELRPNAASFSLATPQQAEGLFEASGCIEAEYVTTDGTLLYFATLPTGWTQSVAYVFAYDPAGHHIYDFPMGTPRESNVLCGAGEPKRVVDYAPPSPAGAAWQYTPNGASGLAVQSHGNLLAIAHGGAQGQTNLDLIRLFDKTSGAPLGEIKIANPKGLAFEPNGDLWAISGNSVVLISNVGTSNTVVRELPNLSAPVAIAVDPRTSEVLVADGGTAQQIKRFSEAGLFLSAYGDEGGYTDCDPTVTKKRLFLDTTAGPGFVPGKDYGGGAFLAVAPDGSYWAGDPGNVRLLHISSDNQYIEQIAFFRYNYNVAADHGDPSRVFLEGLEFHVDYTKPLLPGDPDPLLGGNGSWSLVRNWDICLPSNYDVSFQQVQTFPNGHTYAAIRDFSDNFPPMWINALAELPPSGPLRFSGKRLQYGSGGMQANKYFTHAGNLAYWTDNHDSKAYALVAFGENLLSYDADGWPVWGTPYWIATQPGGNPGDPLGMNSCCQIWWPEPTSNGILATFRAHPFEVPNNHHLGGMPIGGTTWAWKASPGAMIEVPDGKGTYPEGYDGNDGLAALVEGDYIFLGYNGNWGSFSSQWMQWSQDGLLIGQFGHTARSLNPDGTIFSGAAGNNSAMATVSVNGNIYLYSSDEGYHAGIHQWKISGLDTIHELTGSACLGEAVMLH